MAGLSGKEEAGELDRLELAVEFGESERENILGSGGDSDARLFVGDPGKLGCCCCIFSTERASD